jgi:hypothetical protein
VGGLRGGKGRRFKRHMGDYVEERVAGLKGIWVEEEEGDEGGHEGEQYLVGPQPAVLAVESSSCSVASFSPPQASSRACRRA